ncbi:hypothetical protein CDAR_475531 [Caerostris darwini]|uniref:Uncharacterized protein n=1 Tax=Caerostris darwini TaxID=1538125 RepID=A0AAV4P832_9ARAC|nr:hypothetical protein CDAR_475531 [Caerostris darwini]
MLGDGRKHVFYCNVTSSFSLATLEIVFLRHALAVTRREEPSPRADIIKSSRLADVVLLPQHFKLFILQEIMDFIFQL